ncbi:MAG: GatB/YqeY domain-containing protein [Spiribacter sp.]|nr:GatB/YqeY domain-containing protein [Spiribacter sp.]MDR9480803.1 GatB/YqeY domain-containing protein [Spiribacter sp.]
MSELKTRINDAVKAAMRAGEKTRLGTLRMISAAVKQKEVDERRELSDADLLAILDKMVKQRRESLEQYEAAGREELAAVERAEIDIIAEFLPQPLSEADIDALIDQAISATGAASVRDMGQVMAQVKPQVQGRADMGAVSARVKTRLS